MVVGQEECFGGIFQSEQQIGDSQYISLNEQEIADMLEKKSIKSSKQKELARGPYVPPPHLVDKNGL